MTAEFNCTDCGDHVVAFWRLPAERDRCLICMFIDQAPAEDRHALRSQLYDNDQFRYWTRVGCYRDDRCAERTCDHCRTIYRGPGVYCSQQCALAEAG